jgi:hypothetical protein
MGEINAGANDDDAAAPHLHRGGSRRSSWDFARERLQPRAHRPDPCLANGSKAPRFPRGARGPPWPCAAASRGTAPAKLPCAPSRDAGRPPIEGLTVAAPGAMSACALTRAMRSFEGSANDTRTCRSGAPLCPYQVTFGFGVRCALPTHRSATLRFENAIGRADDRELWHASRLRCAVQPRAVEPADHTTAFTL